MKDFLVLQGITKRWGTHSVLNGIELAIARGEFIALLGASGCGKTTLLRILAGLDSPCGGRILRAGEDITALEPSARGMSMVFQSYALFPHLTVAENIVFGLRARKLPAAQQQQRLADAAALVGLEALLGRRPAELSGGQRQRVALARAVVSHHPICLMDEPLSNLDAQLRAEMRSELRALQQKLGLTLIYVTHDQVEAMSMADRIVLMHEGGVAQVGSPAELYESPASPSVARFIGQPPMNLLQHPAKPDSLLGIRPEHVALGAGEPAHVLRSEYHGADTLIEATLHGQRLLIKQAGRLNLAAGSQILVSWAPQHECHFARPIPSPTPSTATQEASHVADA